MYKNVTKITIMFFKNVLTYLTILFISVFYTAANERNDIKDHKLAELYYQKGMDFGKTGIIDSALFYSQFAVKLYENLNHIDSIALANAYQSLGIIYKINGKYSEAIDCYNKAETIYLNKRNEILTAYVYANKANIYSKQKDYSKSKDYLLMAYNIYNRDTIKNKKYISIAYNNLGNIYKNTSDYSTAIQHYKKSIILNPNSKYTTLGNLAICYNNLRNYKLADMHYREAIKNAVNEFGTNNIKSAGTFLNYAVFLSQQNKNENTYDYFESAINIYKLNFGEKHPYLAGAYNDFGKHFLRNKMLDSALFYFQKSLIAISPNFENNDIKTNPDINNVLSKTHYLNAIKNKAITLTEIASKNKNIDLYNLSIQTYDLAIDAINKIRSGYISEESKLILADNENETFSKALNASYSLYEITKEQKYLEKAFNYCESSKSAVLTESIKNNYALNIGGIPDSLINLEKELEKSIWNYEELIYEENKKKTPDENKLSYWNKYLFEKKQKHDELINYLENNFNDYYSLKYSNSETKLKELQKSLKFNDVLVDFSINDSSIYSFIISKYNIYLYKSNIDTTFYSNLDLLLKSLSQNNFSYHGLNDLYLFQEKSNYVYNILIKPINHHLKRKHITIIPDGELAYLPFETLISDIKKYDKLNYTDLPYLIKTNTISYSYSARFLIDKKHHKRKKVKSLAAFAPSYEPVETMDSNFISIRQQYREKLFPLKGIKEEAIAISELTKGNTYIGSKASEKRFKEVAANYDILHLAMHTIMDDENPMYSKMAFSQTADSLEDDFLNTYELYNLKLNSRMAVLSSCNSGSGKLHKGEGVISLARGFFYAGCPSLVMTLWSVEDKSGVNLMAEYYRNLIKGFNKSKSLQKSKLEFIKNSDQLHAHPYFWSGYVIIGNKDALFSNKFIYVLLGGIILLSIIITIFIKKFIPRS